MPTIYELKPAFQKLLRPISNSLVKLGVTANQVTIFALVLSFFLGGLLYWFSSIRILFYAVPIFLFVRMALNAIDGMMAREHKMTSRLGAVLNELGDVISDAVIYLPFAMIAGINAALVVAIVLLAIVSEMAGVVALTVGSSRRYDGPMGKSDRAFLFSVLAILIAAEVELHTWINYLLAAVGLLLLVTIGNRVRASLKKSEDGK